MDYLQRVVADIKSLKIQGAENVAKAAILAWSKAKDKKKAAEMLESARPTEPMLRNAIKYLSKYNDPDALLKMIKEADGKIAKYGSNLLPDNSTIYTHCHSSTAVSVMVKAKKEGKHFNVNLTETRPNLQGRITALALAKHGIDVTVHVDSAAMHAIREADLMLIGADVITSYGSAINKIGSGLFAKVAHELSVPVYVAATAMKFDPITSYGKKEKIEERSPKEVWNISNKHIRIFNEVFEEVEADHITAFITEFGVIKGEAVMDELEKRYQWMFE